MIKFIHCADIRFDMSLGLTDASKATVRREEMKDTFEKLLTYVRDNSVNLVLISGNLFDRRNISRQTLRYLMSSFESCPDCKFVIAPGNEDHYSADSVYETIKFPANVSIFKSHELSSFEYDFNGETVRVYGHACTDPDDVTGPFDKLRADTKGDVINILVSPSDIEDLPDRSGTLARTGVDFAALRGKAGMCGIYDEGDMWYAYPGNLEMLRFDDATDGGFVLVEAYKKDGEFICKPKLMSLMKKRCVTKKINISGAAKESDVISATEKFFEAEKGVGENTLLRLIYTGDVLPSLILPTEKIIGMANDRKVFYFEITDETVPLYNYEYLSEDPTIKGALFNAFRPLICSDDAEIRNKATGAFRIGMKALEGKHDNAAE